MNQYSIPVQNISCEACEKVMRKLLSKFENAQFDKITSDAKTIFISCEQNQLDKIREILSQYGYLAKTGNEKSIPLVKHLAKNIWKGSPAYEAENKLVFRTIGVFVLLLGITFALNYGMGNAIPMIPKIFPVLVLVPFGISLTVLGLFHAHLLQKEMNCNLGMMVGMTMGMLPGFMLGAVLGATNGMFIGSVVGMVVGMGIGGWSGKYVGIMGIMEGMMAGLMAGIMGSMTSIMMIVDNLVPFLYLLFLACGIIYIGLTYLVYKEAGAILHAGNVPKFWEMVLVAIAAWVLITGIAVFGPKSAIAWGAL